VRFHPGEVLLAAVARLPVIALAAMHVTSVVLFDGLVIGAALFHHSNLRLPRRLEDGLRKLIVTPAHHWVHHHARRVDTDSNYGTLLTVWDRLFASFSPTERTPGLRIGVEGEGELGLPQLVARPLRP
jgi:sterol desaturase/sphingolipid hydroxylase (fatty acid hydroxylase superfamily)